MQEALARDAAPLRIPFNRIPDVTAEADAEHHPLWLDSINRAKVLAEAQHRRNNEARPESSRCAAERFRTGPERLLAMPKKTPEVLEGFG